MVLFFSKITSTLIFTSLYSSKSKCSKNFLSTLLFGQLEVVKGTITERLDVAERAGRTVEDVARELAAAAVRAEAEAFQRLVDEAERELESPDVVLDEPEEPGW